MRQLESSTLSNQNISSALLSHTYTADADREIFVRLFADQVAGNGDYVAYLTIQRLGAGSAYRAIPITTAEAASGVTAICLMTIPIPVKNTDVVKVYLTGLGGDTTTPDIITEVWENEVPVDWRDGGRLDLLLDAIPADVWTNATRTLTQSADTIASQVSGSSITIHRGDTMSASLTGLGSIVDRSKLWFTLKDRDGDPVDTAALVQITEADGLVYINGEEAEMAANGSFTIDDEDAGDVTITLKAVETAKLDVTPSSHYYDVQVLRSTGAVETLSSGVFNVTLDTTRATS